MGEEVSLLSFAPCAFFIEAQEIHKAEKYCADCGKCYCDKHSKLHRRAPAYEKEARSPCNREHALTMREVIHHVCMKVITQ